MLHQYLANIGAYFNNSLVHFSLHLVLDHFLSFLDNFLFMAFQFPGLRINHHIFFFNTKGEMFCN